MRYGKFLLGVVLTLLFVGLIASIGWTAYNAGMMQGAVQSGTMVVPTTEGTTAPITPYSAPWAFYRPFGFFHPFGFGLFACLVPFFFIFLFFVLLRLVFRPRWGGPWGHGGSNNGDIPPRVQEWHRKLHEQESQAPTQAA